MVWLDPIINRAINTCLYDRELQKKEDDTVSGIYTSTIDLAADDITFAPGGRKRTKCCFTSNLDSRPKPPVPGAV